MPFFSLGELAAKLGCALHGDASVPVAGVSTLDKAGPQEITFLANVRYAPKAKQTRAAAVIASEPLAGLATLVSTQSISGFRARAGAVL